MVHMEGSTVTVIYSTVFLCAIVRDDAKLDQDYFVRKDVKLPIVLKPLFARCVVRTHWLAMPLIYSTTHAYATSRMMLHYQYF